MSGASLPYSMPLEPRPRMFQRRELFNPAGFACFAAVLSVVFVDINNLTYLTLGTSRIGSPVILLACLSCYASYKFRFIQGLGRAGTAVVLSILLYMAIASAIKLTDFSDVSLYATQKRLQQVTASLIILLAAALGARNAVASGRAHLMIWIAFSILLVSVALVYVSMFFGRSLYAMQDVDIQVAKLVAQGQRSLGGFANPNDTGMAMALTAAFGFACLNGSRRKLIVLAAIAVAGIACVSTFSRSSMIAFVVLGMSQLFSTSIFKNKAAVLISLIALVSFAWFVSQGYKQLKLDSDQERRIASLSELASGKVDKGNTGYRFEVASVGLEHWMDSPLFGHGIGAGSYVNLGMGVIAHGPHNTFIWLLMESGVAPFLAFVLSLGLVGWRSIRCDNVQVRILSLGVLVVYLCNCLVSHGLLLDNVFSAAMGIACGALAGAASLKRQSHGLARQALPRVTA